MLVQRINFIVWLILIILIVLGSYMADSSTGAFATSIIIGATVIKFLLVGFNFMETRKAHVVWKGVLLLTVGVFVFTFLVVR